MLAQTIHRRRIKRVNQHVEKMFIKDATFQLPSYQITGVALLMVVGGFVFNEFLLVGR